MRDPQYRQPAASALATAERLPSERGRVAIITLMLLAAALTTAYLIVWFGLTLPTAKAGGFSVHRRSLRHDSAKGLPGPLDIPRRVLVSIEHEATLGTDMGAHAQRFGNARPTAATVLRGVGG